MGNVRRRAVRIVALILLVIVISVAWIIERRNNRNRDIVDAGTIHVLSVTSSSFADDGTIPRKFTCDGGDVSPQLTVSAPPAHARSLALIVEDPDAPAGSFVHWVAFNLPSTLRDLPEGASARPESL